MNAWRRRTLITFSVIIAFYFFLLAKFIYDKKAYIWLPSYFSDKVKNVFNHGGSFPKHIILLFVDHFEPAYHKAGAKKQAERMTAWMNNYPKFASRHLDGYGRHPQHTWFYPYDEIDLENLKLLSRLCYLGFGEIELHLHHGNDTNAAFESKLRNATESYSTIGALITAEEHPKITYAYIAGNWDLDNAMRNSRKGGVYRELDILKKTGCFADFTFPAVNQRAQPAKINSIYYATDTDDPKSYNQGIDAKVKQTNPDKFLLIEGPLQIDWQATLRHLYPKFDDGEIASYHRPSKHRANLWINSNIKVVGKDNWIFVKIFTHGAPDTEIPVMFGKELDEVYHYLETKYNDGKKYKLHYVTAREAYNIVKAAESGENGDPDQYRDYAIKPYANTKIICNKFYQLVTLTGQKADLKILESGPLRLEFKNKKGTLEKTGEDIPYTVTCTFADR